MSVHVQSWVLRNSEARLGDRLVLIVLADHAKEDGSCAWPSVQTIAKEARMHPRSVQTSLRRLEADEAITATGRSRAGTTIYTVNMRAAFRRGGVSPGRRLEPIGGGAAPPEPSIEPPVLSVRARERAGNKLRFGGKAVNKDAWALTERVLGEFNRQTGHKLRLLSASGEPSQAAKRIYGRIRIYSDLTFEEHADIIRRTTASQWWGDDNPTIGVVYGPGVFEENITRPATNGSNGKAAKPWAGALRRELDAGGAR